MSINKRLSCLYCHSINTSKKMCVIVISEFKQVLKQPAKDNQFADMAVLRGMAICPLGYWSRSKNLPVSECMFRLKSSRGRNRESC